MWLVTIITKTDSGCGVRSMRGIVGIYRFGGVRRSLVLVCCMAILCLGQGMFVDSAVAWILPEGRLYEMVSPPYKADYGIEPKASTFGAGLDGESFVFRSLGAFADARADFVTVPYVARRMPDGWVTSSTNPPPADGRLPGVVDYSPDLNEQLTQVSAQKGGLLSSAGTAGLILSDLRLPEISFVQVWPLPDGPATFPGSSPDQALSSSFGASADLSHLLFQEFGGGLYQIVGLGGPDPREEDVAVVGQHDGPGDAILPGCIESSFEDNVFLERRFHAISDDGSEIFFRHCGVPYVRVNGLSTFELAPAGEFQGASHDGSKAFFTGGAGELLMGVIDSELGHETVTETVLVSPSAKASVVATSDDGSHVYFMSSGVFAGVNAQGHSPETGASNLYVYDSVTRKTTFIAITAITKGGEEYEAQATPDGRFLAFTTDSRLTPDDRDSAVSVYRYDAQTGGLVRVSVGENGHDDNGNDNAFGASIAAPLDGQSAIATWRLSTRALSDDGSTIVFSTVAPFSSRAVNGDVNVYAWHEGRTGMISTGLSQTSDTNPVVSRSGQDIFFLTSQNILPQDSDGLLDVYDARIDGGFPEASVPPGGCSGDTCQGPPSVPSLLNAPASATFSGLGNPIPASKTVTKPKSKPKSRCKPGYSHDKHGKCAKVKRARRAAIMAPDRSHKSSRGGRSS